MKCATCKHSATALGQDRRLQRVCKRYPPTLIGLSAATPQGIAAQFVAMFPAVADEERCGEYAADAVALN